MTTALTLRIKRLHDNAILPTYATAGAACFDLYSCFDTDTDAAINSTDHPSVTIPTGLAFEVPQGYVMLIFSRSGHGFKDNTRLANCVGVIDSDYRGEVQVKLTRDDGGMLFVRHATRIAQATLVALPQVTLTEVDEITETARGANGFGSTGL